MIDFINRGRRDAWVAQEARVAASGPVDRQQLEAAALQLAVREAGVKRFRPILLTSLTTFLGRAPMMFDRSFATAFLCRWRFRSASALVPAAYMILHDFTRTVHRLLGGRFQA